VITTDQDYQKARAELADLESWLAKLNQDHPGAEKGITKAGIRKLLSRLHEELGHYEGTLEYQATKAK
jgi:hypothetical protein